MCLTSQLNCNKNKNSVISNANGRQEEILVRKFNKGKTENFRETENFTQSFQNTIIQKMILKNFSSMRQNNFNLTLSRILDAELDIY